MTPSLSVPVRPGSRYVFPELELIVVFTAGGYYETKPLGWNDVMEDFIFQAIRE